MSKWKGYYVKKVGQNRGAPRVWLEGSQALLAGFRPGARFDVTVEGQTVVLQANPDGSRVVSSKRIGERDNPIIDLNSKELLAVFDGMAAVRVAVTDGQIYLLPLASEMKKQERYKRLREKLESDEPLAVGSVSHGGGILSHALHSGLAKAGIKTELAFANEIRPELLEHARIHNDAWSESTRVYAAPMQELAFDERGLATVPKVDILEMGVPCQSASLSGKAKNGAGHAESHPEVGHLVVSALVILGKANPAIVIFENVIPYANTASAAILRNQLRDLGYETQERVLRGKQWGTIENRDRWCLIATSHGIKFDFVQLMPPVTRERRVGEVLEPIALDDERWSRMEYLKAKHERRDLSRGGTQFAMQVFSADDTFVSTIGKGYSKVRSTEPKIVHPENEELLRQLTPREHARVKDVPEHLIDGLNLTTAHEVLGQGIAYPPFQDLGQHVGNTLNRWVGRPEVAMSERAVPTELAAPALMGAELVAPEVAEMASEILMSLRLADAEKGDYRGRVVVVDDGVVMQDVGRRNGVVHKTADLAKTAPLGAIVTVKYERGRGRVTEARETAQMALQL